MLISGLPISHTVASGFAKIDSRQLNPSDPTIG
jgi:hypothetical protein